MIAAVVVRPPVLLCHIGLVIYCFYIITNIDTEIVAVYNGIFCVECGGIFCVVYGGILCVVCGGIFCLVHGAMFYVVHVEKQQYWERKI